MEWQVCAQAGNLARKDKTTIMMVGAWYHTKCQCTNLRVVITLLRYAMPRQNHIQLPLCLLRWTLKYQIVALHLICSIDVSIATDVHISIGRFSLFSSKPREVFMARRLDSIYTQLYYRNIVVPVADFHKDKLIRGLSDCARSRPHHCHPSI